MDGCMDVSVHTYTFLCGYVCMHMCTYMCAYIFMKVWGMDK